VRRNSLEVKLVSLIVGRKNRRAFWSERRAFEELAMAVGGRMELLEHVGGRFSRGKWHSDGFG